MENHHQVGILIQESMQNLQSIVVFQVEKEQSQSLLDMELYQEQLTRTHIIPAKYPIQEHKPRTLWEKLSFRYLQQILLQAMLDKTSSLMDNTIGPKLVDMGMMKASEDKIRTLAKFTSWVVQEDSQEA